MIADEAIDVGNKEQLCMCIRWVGDDFSVNEDAGIAPRWSKPMLRQCQREPRMHSHKQDLTNGKKRERSLLPTVAPNGTVRQ